MINAFQDFAQTQKIHLNTFKKLKGPILYSLDSLNSETRVSLSLIYICKFDQLVLSANECFCGKKNLTYISMNTADILEFPI